MNFCFKKVVFGLLKSEEILFFTLKISSFFIQSIQFVYMIYRADSAFSFDALIAINDADLVELY